MNVENLIKEYRDKFTGVPNVIYEMGLTAYEIALYNAIKRSAGDGGTCTRSARTLASNAGMSTAMISKTKTALCDRGLIEITEKASGRGQPQHHIQINPLIWIANDAYFLTPAEQRPQGSLRLLWDFALATRSPCDLIVPMDGDAVPADTRLPDDPNRSQGNLIGTPRNQRNNQVVEKPKKEMVQQAAHIASVPVAGDPWIESWEGAQEGYCPHCGESVELAEIKKGKHKGMCKHCGNPVGWRVDGSVLAYPKKQKSSTERTSWQPAVRAFCDLAHIQYSSLRGSLKGDWAQVISDLAGDRTCDEMCRIIPLLDVWNGDRKFSSPRQDRFAGALLAYDAQYIEDAPQATVVSDEMAALIRSTQ